MRKKGARLSKRDIAQIGERMRARASAYAAGGDTEKATLAIESAELAERIVATKRPQVGRAKGGDAEHMKMMRTVRASKKQLKARC